MPESSCYAVSIVITRRELGFCVKTLGTEPEQCIGMLSLTEISLAIRLCNYLVIELATQGMSK